jgi:RHS repeat-associated protein
MSSLGRVVFMMMLVFGTLVTAKPAFAQSVEYYHTDALGTPVTITDADRNVLEHREYEPYGKLLSGPVTDGPGYTGHVADAATGMDYMQQRYYDPEIGRFLSVDPVTPDGNGSNFNRYRYANDNPYAFTDPDGRDPFQRSTRNDGGASAVEGSFNPDRTNAGAHRNDIAKAVNKSIASQAKFNRRTALAGTAALGVAFNSSAIVRGDVSLQVSLSWKKGSLSELSQWRIGGIFSVVPATGASTGVGAAVGVLGTYSPANSPEKFRGWSGNAGGSGGVGLVYGGDVSNISPGSPRAYNGFLGVGLKDSPELGLAPVEAHTGVGWTAAKSYSLDIGK